MAEAVLGTHIIELVTDATKLTRGFDQAERDGKRTASEIAASVGRDIEKGFERARAAVPKLTGAMKSGLGAALSVTEKLSRGIVLTERDLLRVSVALDRVKNGAVASFGSVEKATKETTEAIKAMELALESGTAELRMQKKIANDVSGSATQAGVRVQSLTDVIQDGARNWGTVGQIVSGVAGNIFLAVAAQKTLATAGKIYADQLGGSGVLEYWTKVASKIKEAADTNWDRARGDMWDTLGALLTGDFAGAKKAAIGQHSREINASGVKTNAKSVRAWIAASQEQRYLASGARDYNTQFLPLNLGDEVMKAIDRQSKADEESRKRSLALIAQAAADRRAGEAALASLMSRYNAESMPAQNAETERVNRYYADINAANVATYNAGLEMFMKLRQGGEATAEALVRSQMTALDRIAEEYKLNATTFEQLMGGAVYNVEGLFSDVLFNSITGNLEGIQDSFENFFKNIARQAANFMAQQAVLKLMTSFGFGGATSAASTGGTVMSMFGGVSSANGNVLRGGFRAFANGGIVNRPTLGLIGEGRYNEAVVPLPDGRSIPVENRGAKAPQPINVTVEWSNDLLAGIVRAGAAQGAEMANRQVIGIVSEDLAGNGKLRRVIQTVV